MPQKILIIDDSAAVHSELRAVLTDEPVGLYYASNGEEGLEKAVALMPDLILLDAEMPSPDGFEVCRRLKLDQNLSTVPIIMMTAEGSNEQKTRALESGAVDFLSKPLDQARILARVRSALRMKFLLDLLSSKVQIDTLTGLWNRKYLEQRLEAEVSLARRWRKPLSVLIIDLDNFAQLNEQYGHPIGDDVLRRVGMLLSRSIRMEDTVCRYGGEEFAIIAPNIAAGAVELAERLRSSIESLTLRFGGQEAKVTVSIGIASSSESPGMNLLDEAEQALRRAKQSGRNRVEAVCS